MHEKWHQKVYQKAILATKFTDHSLPDLLYPKGQVQRAFRLLRRLLRSSRKRWERKPEMKSVEVN